MNFSWIDKIRKRYKIIQTFAEESWGGNREGVEFRHLPSIRTWDKKISILDGYHVWNSPPPGLADL